MIYLLFICLFLTSCKTDYSRVQEEAFNGNPYAQRMMEAGFNPRCSEDIRTFLIDKALEGDEQALTYVIAQIETMSGEKPRHSTVFVPMAIPRSR